MNNILVTNISILPSPQKGEPKEFEYEIRVPNCLVKTIKAYHTNESVLKCLVNLQSVVSTGGLSKIIALVSYKSMNTENAFFGNRTALKYFSDIANELIPTVELKIIDLEYEEGKGYDTSVILGSICNEITKSDNVYIDGAGGKRTTSNIIQLLTKILKYTGVNTPCTLYSDIQNTVHYISDTKEFERMTNLADAFNEFMTTGKADQLKMCCMGRNVNPAFENLLKTMGDFSDKIRLGNVEKLDSTINELKKNIEDCKTISQSYQALETVVLQQFLPVIEDKLVSGNDKTIDYVKIIHWCLDNALIQQALTIFVEKIPAYLYKNGLFKYNGNESQAKQTYYDSNSKNRLMGPWESNSFYTSLLTIEPKEVIELRNYLECKKQPTTKRAKDIVAFLLRISKEWNNISDVLKHDERYSVVRDDIRNANSYVALKNRLATQKPVQYKLLGFPYSKTSDTFTLKFANIEWIKAGQSNPDFTILVHPDMFAKIMYGYIYVKATRNSTNHASSNENLNEAQKQVLRKVGYTFGDDSLKSVAANINLALSAVEEFVVSKKKQECIKNEVCDTLLKSVE